MHLVYSSFWWLPYIEKKCHYFHWAPFPMSFLWNMRDFVNSTKSKPNFLWMAEFYLIPSLGGGELSRVGEINSFTSKILLLYVFIFFQSGWWKGLFISVRWKLGLWVEWLSLKKKKIRNQLLDMQSWKPHSLNEISAVCTAVNLSKAADISWLQLEVEGPKLAGSPPPRETVSPVLYRGSFWLSVITGTLAGECVSWLQYSVVTYNNHESPAGKATDSGADLGVSIVCL